MRISLASDHAGFALKEKIKAYLQENNYFYHDFGTFDEKPVDYPDLAFLAASAVQKGEYERGIIVCGTGIGVCIAANKLRGIRAAHCGDPYSARCSREHNDANILAMGARVSSFDDVKKMVNKWFSTPFDGGRHKRRVKKIHSLTGC